MKHPSNRTVYNWFTEFQRGRTFLSDKFREGRPSTSVVATVREMIERDRHITYREIQASLDIDMKAIHTILHDYLSVRKLCSRWIPHNLTEEVKNRLVLNGAKKCSRNSTEVDQIWFTTSLLGTKHVSIRMSSKVNNNPLFGYFKMNRNQQKLFVHAVLPSK